jgi:hypothetical protein
LLNAANPRTGEAAVSRLRQLFVATSLDLEAQLRFRLYTIFVVLAVPNMLVFGTLAIVEGNAMMAVLVLGSGVALVTGWWLARKGQPAAAVYRINALVFGVMVLEAVIVGDSAHSKGLWINVYPLIMIFLLGEREGTAWSAGLLVASLAAMSASRWFPEVHAYPPGFVVRLAITYVVVSAGTFGFEHGRRRFRDRLLLEHQQLEEEKQRLDREIQERERAEREKEALIGELREALSQVQTLKGLVPICSHCHRIRDDKGFWNRLESYLQAHAGTQFSHGICPNCMATLYPDVEAPDDPA